VTRKLPTTGLPNVTVVGCVKHYAAFVTYDMDLYFNVYYWFPNVSFCGTSLRPIRSLYSPQSSQESDLEECNQNNLFYVVWDEKRLSKK